MQCEELKKIQRLCISKKPKKPDKKLAKKHSNLVNLEHGQPIKKCKKVKTKCHHTLID